MMISVPHSNGRSTRNCPNPTQISFELKNSFAKLTLVAAAALILICLAVAPASAADTYFPNGGDGTQENPFRISSEQDLKNLSTVVNEKKTYNNGAGNYNESYYNLTADITLTGDWTPIGPNTEVSGSVSIGPNVFLGTFNGAGFTISNLSINQDKDYLGLFGVIKDANVTNVSVSVNSITGRSSVGGLVGVAAGSTITNCSVTGGNIIATTGYVGGLVGVAEEGSIISNCYAAVNVSSFGGSGKVGGLVGQAAYDEGATNTGCLITNCYAVGAVDGFDDVGGLVGCVGVSTILSTQSKIYNSSALNPSVNGTSNVGRVVGNCAYEAIILNCFAWEGMNCTSVDPAHNDGDPVSSAQVWNNISTFREMGFTEKNWTLNDTNKKYLLPVLTNIRNTEGLDASHLIPLNISFDKNSGDGTMTNQSVSRNAQSSIKANEFTKAGYTFAGWNTQADGGGTDYAEGASIRLDSDITLYAKWDVKYFAEGDGTPANPFRISSVQELQNLSYVVNNSITYNGGNYSESYYNLTENIDLSSVCSAAAGNWTPIGTWNNSSLAQQKPFSGTFDGGNHTISNLYINSPDAKYQGLFGYINSSAVITNVVLYDINISANSGVGGLAGINNGNIDNCCVSGSLKSIGDFAYAGGLIGQNYGTIENCSASVNVDGRRPPVGGLVGSNRGTITNCYAVGTVSGSNNVGGLVGNNPNGIITNCYATGFVNGTTSVGGLVGLHGLEATIANSAALNPSVNGTSNVSRLIGFDNSDYQIINSYAWDGMLVNGAKTTTDDKNGTSASSADVWANLTFWQTVFGSDNISSAGDKLWNITSPDDSTSYPLPYLTSLGKDNSLRAQVSYLKPAEPIHYFSVGNGTADKPYQIKTESDLKNLSKLTNEGTPDETNGGALYSTLNYTVANDITLSVEWTPIGTWNSSNATEQKPFSGNFDGASHTISGLKIINTKDYQGFFGCSINANIKNIRLSIEEINVTGNAQNTGGLVGYFNAKEGFGTVENCTVTGGTVSGNLIVGGLIGYASNFDSLNIQNCSADVNVAGSNNVGGLIGSLSNDGSGILNLRNCFATGDVSGTSYSVGGLIGIADDNSTAAEGLTIEGCYASGDVSGKSYSVGGLIGYAYNVAGTPITVQNCYSLGIVTAAGSMVGGLIGEAKANPGAVILTSSAALNPSVTGNSNVGRVVGYNTTNVTVDTCFGWEGMLINGAAASENYNNGWHAESGYIWDNESTYQGFITDFNTNWKMSENPNYKLPILKWQSEESAAGFNAVYLKPFNISFNSNGGDGGTMTNQSVTGNVSVSLKPNTFTKSGYEFNGWSTTSGGAKIYNDTDSIKITEDTTLYANWTNVPKPPIVSGTNYLTEGTAGIYNISSANAKAIYVDYGEGEPISIYSGSSAVGKHIFHKEGSYTLKATGYNAAGKSSETAFMITVAAKLTEPENPVINDTLQSITSGDNATAVVLIIVDARDTGSSAPVIILQDSTANPPQSNYGNLSANNGVVAIVNISLQNSADDPHNLSHMAMFTIRLNKTAVNTLTNSHPENISVYRNTQFGGEWTQTPVYSVYNQSANTTLEYAYDVKTPGFSFFTFVAAADVSTPHILPPEPEPYDDDDWQPVTATATPVKTKTPTPAATSTAEQTKAPENTQTAVPTYVEPTMTKTAEPAATATTSPIGIAGIGLGVLGALIALRRK